MRRRRDYHLVRIFHLVKRERPLDYRNACTIRSLNQVRFGNATQDMLVIGMGVQLPIFQDADVRMRAFGHNAVAMKNRFVSSCLLRFMRIQNSR